MQPSSIGLATAVALTFLAFGPAHAGFVGRSPRIVPSIRPMMTNHAPLAGRFGMRHADTFRRGHDRQFPSFGIAYFGGPAYSPPADSPPLGFVGGAPTVNVTIVTSAPVAASSSQANYVESTRTKIIFVGARRQPPHPGKLPIVIYGRS
jgi:hypothetical protein